MTVKEKMKVRNHCTLRDTSLSERCKFVDIEDFIWKNSLQNHAEWDWYKQDESENEWCKL